MIQTLSETVILPIAGVILAIVMTLELIQIITDRNNFHEIETAVFFKWMFKSACAILIVTNTWTIVMGIFDAAQSVVAQAAGVVVGDATVDISTMMDGLEERLMEMDIGPLFGLWFQSLFVNVTAWAVAICIFIVIYGRMLEVYLTASIAPIPMATMMGKEFGGMGQNYLQKPARARVPGVSHHRLRRHLRGARPKHSARRGREQGHLDVHGLHGAALLHAVQDVEHGKEHLRRALRNGGNNLE